MPVLAPLVQLGLATLRGLGKALSYQTVRRWVLPIIAYEAAGWIIEMYLFALKRRASEFFISRKSDEVETGAFLAWAELSRSEVDKMSRARAEKLISRFLDMRAKAKPGSQLAYTLQSGETGGEIG